MSWYKRTEKGIVTPTEEKLEVPDGLWHQCPSCKKIMQVEEHAASSYVCPACNYHDRINSKEYFEVLFDENEFVELDEDLSSANPLSFVDTQPYPSRIVSSVSCLGKFPKYSCSSPSSRNSLFGGRIWDHAGCNRNGQS